jgi:hypothetical protein
MDTAGPAPAPQVLSQLFTDVHRIITYFADPLSAVSKIKDDKI